MIVVMLRALCGLALLAWEGRAGGDCAQMVGFKDSSSGSTWWAQVLNSLPHVKVDVELLTSKDATASGAKATAKVVKALSPPSACGGGGGGGGGGGATLTGFTVNPHHARAVDWGEVARRRPRGVAVVWDRSNYVKKVVSAVLYEQPGCKSHNVQRAKQARRCRAARTAPDPSDFVRRVRGEACDSAELFEAAGAVWPNGTGVHAMSYETFRLDPRGEVARLFAAVGLDAAAVATKLKTKTRTIKRSPEDVRHTLTNFDAVAAALRAASPPACDLEAMLRDAAAKPFRCDAAAVCAHLKRREKGPG